VKRALILASLVVCSGCATGKTALYRVNEISYKMDMVEVERPAQARERWGEAIGVELLAEDKYRYEDDLLSAEFEPLRDQVAFEIWNKTDHTIKLLWDEAAFIDTEGKAARLMHIGVSYGNRNAPQPPSVIPAHGSISDAANPTDRVFFRQGYMDYWHSKSVPGSWEHVSLITPFLELSKEGLPASDTLKAGAQEQVGKRVGFLLPFQTEGATYEYTFWFEVKDFEVLDPVPPNEHYLFK
jgi:hypothetical protein